MTESKLCREMPIHLLTVSRQIIQVNVHGNKIPRLFQLISLPHHGSACTGKLVREMRWVAPFPKVSKFAKITLPTYIQGANNWCPPLGAALSRDGFRRRASPLLLIRLLYFPH
jgi:hypothetical protein